jgi:hypothetical protein
MICQIFQIIINSLQKAYELHVEKFQKITHCTVASTKLLAILGENCFILNSMWTNNFHWHLLDVLQTDISSHMGILEKNMLKK